MSDFYWVPDQGPKEDTRTDVNETKFGEGYAQRTSNGINSVSQHWAYNFTLRTKAEILAIRAFLKTKFGVHSFTLTNSYGEEIRVTSKTWSTSINHDGDCSASVTFDQVFEIA